MKNLLTFSFVLLLVTILSFQTAYSGPTKTVGGLTANYPTLKAAFDDINNGTLTSAITLQIIDNTTETASAVLYQSGYTGTGGTSNYTSILIYPTVTGKCISGTISQGAVIVLDGAKNVTIDGRLNTTGFSTDLGISNLSADGSGTSTIMFTGTSQYAGSDFIKYCKIKGSETDPSSGVIFFSTAASTHGNNNNSIFNNEITCSSAGRPINAIYSYGNGSYINTADTISNNNIHDFINPNNFSCGIYLSQYTEGWTITGNSFYESASFTPGANVEYDAIRIDNSSAANIPFTVTGNYIGGSSPNCGSSGSVSSWTKTNDYDNIFTGIYLNLNPGFTTASSVQSNIIQNFNWSNGANSSWSGIYIAEGTVNIGTSIGNTIGATTGTGSVTVTGATTGMSVYGIYIASSVTVNCKSNLIGSITAANASSNASNIYGIYEEATAGTMNISNNTIGSSTTAGSIKATSPSSTSGNNQDVIGIYTSGSGIITIDNNIIANMINGTTNSDVSTTGLIDGISCDDVTNSGTVNITNNNIHNLSIANANNSTINTGSICGIALSATSLKNLSGNTIYNLSNNYASYTGNVTGLYFTGTYNLNIVQTSFIHDLSVNSSSTGASIYGILISSGATTYYNNIISLTASTQTTIYGIYETGATNNDNYLYFNTIYIGGSPTAGSLNSYALYSAATTNQRDFRNNIFYNAQSRSGANGKYYAAFFNYSSTTKLSYLDYNDYFTTGTGGILGNYGGTDVNTLPLITGLDANSININPALVLPGGASVLNYTPTINLNGTSLVSKGITTDYTGNSRASTPTMGALEKNASFNVEVWKSGVLQSGYFTLHDAFNKINDGTHTGVLIVKIRKNTIEKNSAVLNASGMGSANYSNILIYPTASGITESGNLDAPLIDLNGASNVTIDGRVNGTGSAIDLVITNSSTGSTAASTILFTNSADNNTVKYCTIKGSETSTATGVIYFSQSFTGTGNNNNIIDSNNITSDPAGRPIYAVFSQGASGYLNSGDAINNNSFYNFLSQGKGSYGIYLGSYSSNFTISGNSFYETTSFIPTAVVEYDIIDIYNSSGIGFNVTGNYIGGTSALCGGTAWTKTNAKSNVFVGILVNAGTNSSSSIQNNTIQNFAWSNNSSSAWTGINVIGGTVNIGTITGNTIGASSGTGSITVTGATASGTNVYGININLALASTVDCENNIIGSITTANTATLASNFYGINKTATLGTTIIKNNSIGSTTTANSINASSASTGNAQSVYGINSAGTGIVTISGNTIANMTNGTTNQSAGTAGVIDGIAFSNGTDTISNNTIHDLINKNSNSALTANASVCGIALSSATTKVVTGNTIYNLTNTYTTSSFNGGVIGLYFSGNSGNIVSGNFIHDLSVSSTTSGSTLYGIYVNSGTTTFYNNIISLSANKATTIYGIWLTGTSGSNVTLYFNTVYIGGTLPSNSSNSFALYSTGNSNTRILKNNIFCNVRTNNSGASGVHFATYFNYSTSTNLTLNYNEYYAPNVGDVLGYYNSAQVFSLPLIAGMDANSVTVNPAFTLAGSTVASDYQPHATLAGVTGTGITTDYGLTVRSATSPTMGAWEKSPCQPNLIITGSLICANAQGTGTITSTTSQTGASYQLVDGSNNNIQTAKSGTGSSLVWSGLNTGTYHVSSTGPAPAYCHAGSDTVNVNSAAYPVTLVITGSTIHNNGVGTITSTTSQSGVSYQLKDISNNNIQSAKNGTNSGLTWSSLSTGTYYVVSTGAAPTYCLGSSDTVKVINEYTGFSVNLYEQFLTGNSFVFANLSTITSGTQSFLWNFGDGNTSTLINPTYSYSIAGTYTVKLVSTSDKGYKDSSTIQVIVDAVPHAGFTVNNSEQYMPGNSFVFTNTSTLSIGTLTYLWNFGDGFTSTLTNPTHNYSVAGTYTVKLVATSDKGYKDSTSQTMTVDAVPHAGFTVNNAEQYLTGNSFVFTNTSTLSIGSLTYLWNFGDGNTSTLANPTYNYTTAGTYIVKLIVTSDKGYKDSTSQTMTVDAVPHAGFTVNNAEQYLTGNSFVFTNTSTLSIGTLTYLWKFGDGTTTTTLSPTHSYTTAGTYIVKLIVTSDKGYKDSTSQTMTVDAVPHAGFTVNNAEQYLTGNSFVFTNTSTLSIGTLTYLWNFGDGFTSTLINPTHNYSVAGTYIVKLIATSDKGYKDSTSQTMTVDAVPHAGFTVNNAEQYLTGNSFAFTNTSTLSIGTLTYLWKFGDGTTTTTLSPTHSYTTAGTYIVKLIVTSDKGYKDSTSQTMTVDAVPHAGFTVNNAEQYLTGNSFVFTNTSTLSIGTLTYLWNFGDGNTSTLANPTYNYTTAGTYIVKLVVTSDKGYKDSTSQTMTVDAVPHAGFTVNNAEQYLTGNSFVFTNTSTLSIGTLTYLWNFGDGNTSTLANPTYNYTTAGTYIVKLVVTSDKGYKDSTSQTMTVDAVPHAGFTVNNAEQYLTGNSFVFTNASTISVGTLTYLWNFGDGNTSTLANPTYNYTTAGTYIVKLVVTSDKGYKDSTSQTMIVDAVPHAGFTVNNAEQYLTGNSFVFTNTSTLSVGTLTYLWKFGDGTTLTTLSPTHSYTTAGTYIVKLVVTSDKGYKDSTSQTMTVDAVPHAGFTVNNAEQYLTGNSFVFTNTSTLSVGTLTYLWNFGDGYTSALTNPTHNYSVAGTYTVKLIATSNKGYKDSTSQTMIVDAVPHAGFTVNNTEQYLTGNSFVFTNTSTLSIGTLTYLWNFGDGFTSTLINPTHNYSVAGTYIVKLIATSNKGYKDSTSQTMTVDAVPHAGFTVNNAEQYLTGNSFAFTNTSTLSIGTLTYLWKFGDGTTLTTLSPTHSYTTAGTYIVKLVVTSDKGYKDSTSQTMTVDAVPHAGFTVNNAEQYLTGNSFVFTNTSTLSIGSLTYLWNFGDGNTSTLANPTYNYTTAGTYIVKLVVTSDKGYKDSTSQTMTVDAVPHAGFTVNNTEQYLTGNSFVFTNTSTLSIGTLTCLWNFGDGFTSTLINPTHNYSVAGTYIVKLIATSNKGYKDSTSQTMTVDAVPHAGFTVNNAEQYLTGNSFAFTNTSTLSIGTLTYLWKFGDGTTLTTLSPTHSYTTAGTYIVKLVVTSDKGYKDSTSQTMTVDAVPHAGFTVNNAEQYLTGNSFVFTNTSTLSVGTLTYLWKFGDGTTSSATKPTHSYTMAGTYTVKLIVTSDKGYKDSTSQQMIVDAVPHAGFTVNNSEQYLTGNSFVFTNTSTISTGSLTYLWNFGDGATSALTNPSHNYSAAGTYTVKLVATSNKGYKDSTSLQVIVDAVPHAGFTVNQSSQSLSGNSFVFTNTSSISVGSLTYLWKFGDGITSTSTNPTHSYSAVGTFTVKLIVTSNKGYKDSTSISVIVIDPQTDICSYTLIGKTYVEIGNYNIVQSGSIGVTNSNGVADLDDHSKINSTGSFVKAHTIHLGNSTTTSSLVYSPAVVSLPTMQYNTYTGSYSNVTISQNTTTTVSTNNINLNIGQNCNVTITGNNYGNITIGKNCTVVFTQPVINTQQFTISDNNTNTTTFVDFTQDTKLRVVDNLLIGTNTVVNGRNPYNVTFYVSDEDNDGDEQANIDANNTFFNASVIIPGGKFGTNGGGSNYGSGGWNWGWNYGGCGSYHGCGSYFGCRSNCCNNNSTTSYLTGLFVANELDGDAVNIIWNGGCNSAPKPLAGFSVDDSTQCLKGNNFNFTNTSLTTSPLSFLWNFGDGATSTAANPSHSYSTSGTFNVSLIITTAKGAKDTATGKEYVYSMPNSGFSVNDSDQILTANNFIFTNLSTVSSGTLSYLWKFGDGSSSTTKNPTHSYSTSGIFTVMLYATSVNGCVDSSFVHSIIYPIPHSGFTVNDSTQCLSGNNFIFTNTSTLASGSMTYLWKFGDGITSTLTSPTHSYSTPGTYSIKLVVTSNLGYKDSTSFHKSYVYSMPNSAFSVNDSDQIITGNHFIFTNLSTVSSGTLGYLWKFGDGSSSTTKNPTHNYSSSGIFTVMLYATSVNGCVDSSFVHSIIYPIPHSGFTVNDSTQCLAGNNFIFTNTSTLASGSMTYLWKFGDGITSTLTSPTHSYSTPGTYSIKLVVTSNLGYKDSTSFHKSYVYSTPHAVFSVNDSDQVLSGNHFIFTNSSTISSGTISYLWKFGDGNCSSTTTNPTHNYSASGTFTVILYVTSNNGCVDTAFRHSIVYPVPHSSFTVNDSTQCLKGNKFIFTNTSTLASGSMTYLWKFGDGITSTSTSPTHIYSTSGTYTVKLIVTSNLGYKDSTSHKSYVYAMPHSCFTVDDSIQCLNGNKFNFTCSSTICSGSMSYLWKFGDGATSNCKNTSHSHNCIGTFTEKLITISDNSCNDTFARQVIVCSYQHKIAIDDPSQSIEVISVFPNPATDYFNIQISNPADDIAYLSLIDMSGKEVMRTQIQMQGGIKTYPIRLYSISNGIYTVKVQTATTVKLTKLIVN